MRNTTLRALAIGAFALATALPAAQQPFQGRGFEAYVSRSGGGRYQDFNANGKPTLKVRRGEEYSITVRNPLPVRAAVAVSIDGLNSADGKRSTPRKAKKWILEPNSSITISGWQTSGESSRAFVFSDESASYAKWKERRDQKEYSKNLGVIGVAWFWNADELDRAMNPPKPFEDEALLSKADNGVREKRASAAPSAAMGGSARAPRAGTGMGRLQEHRVTEVDFNETAGMFRLNDVMKIYYEFASEPPVPQPFESEDGDGRFAPDMTKAPF